MQWHEEVWETSNFWTASLYPVLFFHHKDGLFEWLTSYSDIDSVLDFKVQEFLWSSLLYEQTFYMLNIYIFQYKVTLWNPFLSVFENQSHK